MDPVAGNLRHFFVTVEGDIAAGGPSGHRDTKSCAVLEWEDSEMVRGNRHVLQIEKPSPERFFLCKGT